MEKKLLLVLVIFLFGFSNNVTKSLEMIDMKIEKKEVYLKKEKNNSFEKGYSMAQISWVYDIYNEKERVKNSDNVFTGKILKELSTEISPTGGIVTNFEVEVKSNSKGEASKKIVVSIPGGRLSVGEYLSKIKMDKDVRNQLQREGYFDVKKSDFVYDDSGFSNINNWTTYKFYVNKIETNKYNLSFDPVFLKIV